MTKLLCLFSLKLFIGSKTVPYTGARDLQSLVEFVGQHTETKEVCVCVCVCLVPAD